MSKNNDQNKIIMDSLLAPEKEEVKKIKKEKDSVDVEIKNPYKLDSSDEKYFKLFVGTNYESIVKGKINLAALIFAGSYLIYRKLYLLGLTWVIFDLIFLILLPLLNVNLYIVGIIILISHIICGMVANSSYINHVGMKIIEYRERDKKNLKELLITNGGTNLILASIVFIISLTIGCFSLYDEIIDASKKMVDKNATQNSSADTEVIINFKYDGVLKEDNTVNIKELLSIPAVDGFKDLSTNDKAIYLLGENEILPQCLMEVSSLTYKLDKVSFLKSVAKYYNELPENVKLVETKHEWATLHTVGNEKETIYNVMKKDDKLYLLKVSYTNEYKDTCQTYYNVVISGIE